MFVIFEGEKTKAHLILLRLTVQQATCVSNLAIELLHMHFFLYNVKASASAAGMKWLVLCVTATPQLLPNHKMLIQYPCWPMLPVCPPGQSVWTVSMPQCMQCFQQMKHKHNMAIDANIFACCFHSCVCVIMETRFVVGLTQKWIGYFKGFYGPVCPSVVRICHHNCARCRHETLKICNCDQNESSVQRWTWADPWVPNTNVRN